MCIKCDNDDPQKAVCSLNLALWKRWNKLCLIFAGLYYGLYVQNYYVLSSLLFYATANPILAL